MGWTYLLISDNHTEMYLNVRSYLLLGAGFLPYGIAQITPLPKIPCLHYHIPNILMQY